MELGLRLKCMRKRVRAGSKLGVALSVLSMGSEYLGVTPLDTLALVVQVKGMMVKF